MTFHPRNYFTNNEVIRKVLLMNDSYTIAESYASQAHKYDDAATNYEEKNLPTLAKEQTHLKEDEKVDLLKILQGYPALFAGLNNRQLGIFLNWKYH